MARIQQPVTINDNDSQSDQQNRWLDFDCYSVDSYKSDKSSQVSKFEKISPSRHQPHETLSAKEFLQPLIKDTAKLSILITALNSRIPALN